MQSKVPPPNGSPLTRNATNERAGILDPARGLVWLVARLLALAVIGAIYQAVATQDQRTFSQPGEMVDVGTHSLHINCVGRGQLRLSWKPPTWVCRPTGSGCSSCSQRPRACAPTTARGWAG